VANAENRIFNSNKIKCQECGKEIDGDLKFLSQMWKPVSSSSNKIKCQECGKRLMVTWNFVPNVGNLYLFINMMIETNRRGGKRDRKDDDDDDEEGGILGV